MIKSILREGLFFKGAPDEKSNDAPSVVILGFHLVNIAKHRDVLFLVVLCAIQDL